MTFGFSLDVIIFCPEIHVMPSPVELCVDGRHIRSKKTY